MTNRERMLAARAAREATIARSADLARRTLGVQPDLFGGAPRQLVIPSRPTPSRWRRDLLRYMRAVSTDDAASDEADPATRWPEGEGEGLGRP